MTPINKNPLATLIVLTYRHENFVREALLGAFSQTYQPLEIIVSDDASSDSTWDVIHEVLANYQGPHKVIARRNPNNLGINQHFNELMPLVMGEYVVISAGDDVSLPDRVSSSVSYMKETGRAGIHSNAIRIDEEGKELGLLYRQPAPISDWETMLQRGLHGVTGATLAWSRKVNDVFGPIPETPLGEDAFIPFRCALIGGLGYVEDAQVLYRSHDGNISFWKALEKDDRRQVGAASNRHRIDMLESWRNDINVARQQGCLDDLDFQNAEQMISEQKELLDVVARSMNIPLYKFALFAWRRSKLFTYLQKPFSKMLENYLVYANPRLLRLYGFTKWPARLWARIAEKRIMRSRYNARIHNRGIKHN